MTPTTQTQMPQYKDKYSNPDTTSILLSTLTNPLHVANLFYINKQVIEEHPWLKEEFRQKNQTFQRNQQEQLAA